MLYVIAFLLFLIALFQLMLVLAIPFARAALWEATKFGVSLCVIGGFVAYAVYA